MPDADFSGILLIFDLYYENLQLIDSPRFAIIDWPYTWTASKTDGSLKQIRLFDHATQVGGEYTPASGTFTFIDAGMQVFDRVTLWCQNHTFDYIVPGKLEIEFSAASPPLTLPGSRPAGYTGTTHLRYAGSRPRIASK